MRASGKTGHPSGLRVQTADLSMSRPPRWAWQDRLPLGCLSLLIGNEGVGKGTLAAWVIARLTRGELVGDLHGKPVVVGVVGDEDSFSDVWTPRLHAAGADLARVMVLDKPDGGVIAIRDDRDQLARAVEIEQIRFLFFDQLLDNLGRGVDDWRGKAVREALVPLRLLARELDVAVTGALHPNKRGDSFREIVSGSTAFNALSRSSLLLAEHPAGGGRRAVVRGKGNMSDTPPAVEFEIATSRFEANGYPFDVPQAVEFATSDLTVGDLMGSSAAPRAGAARSAAREVIAALLADREWHDATAVFEACAARGIYERATRRAADDLGAEREPLPGAYPATWRWRLAPRADPAESADRSVRPVRTGTVTDSDSRSDCPDSTPNLDSSDTRAVAVPESWEGSADLDAELARLGAKGLA